MLERQHVCGCMHNHALGRLLVLLRPLWHVRQMGQEGSVGRKGKRGRRPFDMRGMVETQEKKEVTAADVLAGAGSATVPQITRVAPASGTWALFIALSHTGRPAR